MNQRSLYSKQDRQGVHLMHLLHKCVTQCDRCVLWWHLQMQYISWQDKIFAHRVLHIDYIPLIGQILAYLHDHTGEGINNQDWDTTTIRHNFCNGLNCNQTILICCLVPKVFHLGILSIGPDDSILSRNNNISHQYFMEFYLLFLVCVHSRLCHVSFP